MSRPQESQRPILPFGNALRFLLPKRSFSSPNLTALLNAFEETLGQKLRELKPNHKDDVLSLSWMKLAIKMLSETHNDIKYLITDLDLPVCDWDEKWIDVYLNNSVKLLDIGVAFSSEVSRLSQGHLLLKCALHNFDSTSSTRCVKAGSSLDYWKQHLSSKNPRMESCFSILEALIQSLNLPKVKNSAKGKVLMRAMYGVKAVTVFICGLFAAAVTGSVEKVIDLHVSTDKYLWAEAFADLQKKVDAEIKNKLSSGRSIILKELEAVDFDVRNMYLVTQDGISPVAAETFQSLVSDLGRSADKFSQGLDQLTKEVSGFFEVVFTGRDALLCNLRVGNVLLDRKPNTSVKQQAVR